MHSTCTYRSFVLGVLYIRALKNVVLTNLLCDLVHIQSVAVRQNIVQITDIQLKLKIASPVLLGFSFKVIIRPEDSLSPHC